MVFPQEVYSRKFHGNTRVSVRFKKKNFIALLQEFLFLPMKYFTARKIGTESNSAARQS